MRPRIAEPVQSQRAPAAGRPLVIERPDLQTRAQRYGYLSVTFVCWFLWLYLFVPLLSFVAWALGATVIYQAMLQNLDTAALWRLIQSYGTGIVSLAAIYVLWAFSSYLRFRHADRRGRPPDATDQQLAASHRISAEELQTLRSSRRLVVSADQLQRMFSDDPPAEPPGPAADLPEPRRAAGG
ncbi:MAG: poly-beta-1,6-N-acetyl-D-glucosamine biosynthesis protein PgaD [Gammaproteobacteria bacterium]|nr:poly-beta-1,6-N-acetyl-D-glucosamine biosynthesis protein PgaD [Gammaproteobacteria bacterium]